MSAGPVLLEGGCSICGSGTDSCDGGAERGGEAFRCCPIGAFAYWVVLISRFSDFTSGPAFRSASDKRFVLGGTGAVFAFGGDSTKCICSGAETAGGVAAINSGFRFKTTPNKV